MRAVSFFTFIYFLSEAFSPGAQGSKRDYDSPESAALYPALAEMVRLKNWIFGSFWELSEDVWSPEARQEFLDWIEEDAETKDDGCLACTVCTFSAPHTVEIDCSDQNCNIAYYA